ncbi:hypothetical protein [uncultured Chitinophaga sp.]|uniref:hypothetical protein n=1 Tax=uncultured Chitinophaga sp. TaxID=339340 RepID=UPI0025DE8C27|nr:hypothetical protein [uncultured Chitinophaga sp.]
MTEVKVPEANGLDKVSLLLKFAFNSVPGGAILYELYTFMVPNSLEKRRDRFFSALVERMNRLEQEGKILLDRLRDSEEFHEILMEATRQGILTADEEKRKAFVNIILNSALGNSPDHPTSMIFLGMMREFTSLHIKMLVYCNDPKAYLNNIKISQEMFRGLNTSQVFDYLFPQKDGYESILDKVHADLYTPHLIYEIGVSSSIDDCIIGRIKPLGENFLKFITEPPLDI